MTRQMQIERPDGNGSYGFFKLLSITFLFLYIGSLYVIVYSSYAIISDLLFVATFLFTALDFAVTRNSFRLDYSFYSLLLFVAYAAISALWSVNPTNVGQMVFTLIQLFIFYILVRMNITDEKDLKVVLWGIYVGAFVMCLYTIAYYGVGEIASRISVGARIGQEINQVNGMGLFCTLLNIMTLYYIVEERRWWCVLVLPVSIFVMLGAGSRKSFLLMAFALIILFMFKSKKGVVIRFLLMSSIVVFGMYMVVELADTNYFFFRIAQVFEIFQDDQAALTDGSLTTRSDMILFGLDLFKENPIFGYGPEQYEHFYAVVNGARRPPHCTYIQILVGYGSIGFVLFYGIYVYVFKKFIPMFRARRRYSLLMITFILVFLANDFGANMLNNKFLYMFFAIYVAYIQIKLDDEKGNVSDEDYNISTEISY